MLYYYHKTGNFQGGCGKMLRPIKWKTSLDIMTREETEALHAASLRILSQSGILMPLPQKIYDQLASKNKYSWQTC